MLYDFIGEGKMFYDFLEDATPSGNNTLITVIFVVIIVAMIGLLIWQTISGKKKQKEAQDMIDALKIGDRIKTIGGVCGFLVEINNAENTIVIETGTDKDKCRIKFDKGAIYQTGPANPNKPEVKEEKAEEKAEEITAAEEAEAETEIAEKPVAKKSAKKSK